jgi:hypothetical protein
MDDSPPALPLGRAALIASGIGLIWLDHSGVMRKREPPFPLDETTLRGRTLKLRDEIQKFLHQLSEEYGRLVWFARFAFDCR